MKADGYRIMLRDAAQRHEYGDSSLLDSIAEYLAQVEEAREILRRAGLAVQGQPIVEVAAGICAMVDP